MRNKNFTREIPDDYILVKYVDAKKNQKTIWLYLLISFLPPLIGIPALIGITNAVSGYNFITDFKENFERVYVAMLIAFLVLLVYLVLHELTHGVTYKIFTGGKLTFGLTLTVAFCGVPDLYVRRKASMWALVMPFMVFNVIFLGLTIGLYFISPLYGILAGAVGLIHLGGCVGDLHWLLLYLTKFRGCDTLMRDTGPTQYLYMPAAQAAAHGFKPITLPQD